MSERKIIDYKTMTAENPEALDAKVMHALAQGFQPYGDPYQSDNKALGHAGEFLLTQAMVKYGDDK